MRIFAFCNRRTGNAGQQALYNSDGFLCPYRSDAVLDFQIRFLFHTYCQFSSSNTHKRTFHDNHFFKNALIVYSRLYRRWITHFSGTLQYYVQLKHCQC